MSVTLVAGDSRLKVALVCPYDWSVAGGVRTHVRELAGRFRTMGHDVTVFAPASRPGGVDGDCVPMGRPRSVHAMGTVARIRLGLDGRAARHALDEGEFDVVHVHEPLMPSLPYSFLSATRALTVGTFHAAREDGNWLYWMGRPALRRWHGRLDGRVAVSPAAESLITRYFPGEYRVIPNGIDYCRWATAREPLSEFQDGRRTILFVGRPEKRKGLRDLLDAFAILRSRRNDVRLVVVGAGDFSRYQSQYASSPDVVFRSNVPEADLPRYHYSADIFCAPNTGGESQGYVLMEAMAAGCPVVASDIEGFAAVARNGVDALLVPPRVPTALANAIETLLDDPVLARRLGSSARERAATYAWDGVAAQVMGYYRELLVSPAQLALASR